MFSGFQYALLHHVKLYSLHTANLHKVTNTVDSLQNVSQSGGKEPWRRRTRSESLGSPEQLVRKMFRKEAVLAALDGFESTAESEAVLMQFGNSNLVAGCESLKQSTQEFMSHNGGTVTFSAIKDTAPRCRTRIEHGLHQVQKECKAEWLTELVEKHFADSALKEAWDTVIAAVQAKWPRRKVHQVLMVTGDCSGCTDSPDLYNVVFGNKYQRVRCHWDGFHVVCFVAEGDKRFLVAKHSDFPANPSFPNRNVNERHDIDPLHFKNSSKFKEAFMQEGHVLFMQARTLHEVCRAA
jgi:hypothetical protein